MQSIVSYPDRGPYGKPSWRGNTTGRLLVDLFNHYKPTYVVEPAEGSGTTGDVCRELGIQYTGLDLHSGFNLLKMPLINFLQKAPDFIFFHPPYGDMIKYSGNVWGDKTHPDDLSHCKSPEEFLDKLQFCLFNIYDALRIGGYYAVLIGDQRKNGRYLSYQSHIINFGIGRLKDIVIKIQHNCRSDKLKYYSTNFIPIKHEYLLIFIKDRKIISIGSIAFNHSIKMSKSFYGTWKNVVYYALQRMGGKATLNDLYKFIENNIQADGNKHIRAKIRQTVNRYFKRLGPAYYGII